MKSKLLERNAWRIVSEKQRSVETLITTAKICLSLGWLLFAVAPLAQAEITVLHYYRMGEDDPGLVQQGAMASQTRDSVGTNDLTLFRGLPYSTNVSAAARTNAGSAFAMNFGAGQSNCTAALASTLMDNFGLEAWVKPSLTSTSTIVYNGDTSFNGWGLIQNGTSFRGMYGGVAIFGSATGLITTNVWTHIALVRANGLATLYVNGVALGIGGSSATPNTPAGFFGVGCPPQGGGGQLFPGQIDEVRVFSFVPGRFSPTNLLVNSTVSAPGIVSQYVRAVAPGQPVVEATINPRGLSTRAFVQYGLTTNYTFASALNFLPASTADTPTSISLNGLTPGATVHYRLVASNDAGVSNSVNQTFTVWGVTNYTVTSTNDSGPGTLREALSTVANGATISLAVTGSITLNSFLPLITNALTLQGPGATQLTISGGGSNRVFFVDAPGAAVWLSGFTVANGQAKGGDGGRGLEGAGGGLGAGGAIFVNAGNVTVSNLNLAGNSALGGNGGAGMNGIGGGSGGGGGLGGDGGAGHGFSGGGGGGFSGRGGSALLDGGGGGGGFAGNGGNGGNNGGGGGGGLQDGMDANGATGGPGGLGGGGAGGHGTGGAGNSSASNGLDHGGGGGGGHGYLSGYLGGHGGNGGKFGGGGGADYSGHAGHGGEFGGGAGGAPPVGTTGVSGNGGFGGGGGGCSANGGGNGGFGGGGGGKICSAVLDGAGGTFGGRGASGSVCIGGSFAGGGGGAALGGAVFVRGTNATFNWVDSASDGGMVTPGQPGAGGSTPQFGGWMADPGRAAGSALFLMGGTNVFTVSSGQQTIAGDLGGWTNTPVTFVKQGAGTLVLPATNTLPGATLVNGGTLRIDGDHRASSNVTVNAGGTIAGRGRVAGLRINDGGGLSPGASPGALNASNTVWSGAGNYNWQVLDAAGATGTGYDVLAVNGTLDVSGANGFRINLWSISSTNPDVNGATANFTNSVARVWTLATTTAGVIGFNATNFVINTGPTNGTGGFANPTAGSFSVAVSESNLVLHYFPFPPLTAQTLPATGVRPTTATLSCTINPGGLVTTYSFQYGFTTNYGLQSSAGVLPGGVTATPVSVVVPSLLPGYTYHYRVVASNSASMAFGSDVAFLTPVQPPAGQTLPATNIAFTSATARGSATANGVTTRYWFEYGTTTNYGWASTTNFLPPHTSVLRFNGANQHITTAQSLNLSNQSLTVEAWVRRAGTNRDDYFLQQGSSGAAHRALTFGWRNNNRFAFAFWNNDLETSTPQTDTNWHHWAGTFDAATRLRLLFRDGVVVASNTSPVLYQGTGTITLARSPGANTWFGGDLSEVRLWSTARSAAEIAHGMNFSMTGSEPGLLASWRLNDGSGLIGADASTNANHGTLVNAPAWFTPDVQPAALTGLTPGTSYHFRLVGANSAGTTVANDLTFATLPLLAPQLTQPMRLPDGSFQLSYVSTPAAPFTALATTNIAQPPENWTVLGPAIESPAGSGQFQFTDPQATNFTRRFYLLRSP